MTTPVFAMKNATAGYDGRAVLHGVDFVLYGGEAVAVLGANGSGKSTLVRTLLGATSVTSGSVELFGVPAGSFRQWSRIGYVPQRLAFGTTVPASVREVVTSGRLSRTRRFRPLTGADHGAIARAIDLVELTDMARTPVAELSGGQQRRALIARALAGEPDVLVMDEPMAGLDQASQTVLSQTLTSLVGAGATLLLVAHELGPVAPLITRVVTMRGGEVVCDGPTEGHAGHDHLDDHDPHPHGVHAPASGIGLTG
jgi:zinc transport system ATP-binding protein